MSVLIKLDKKEQPARITKQEALSRLVEEEWIRCLWQPLGSIITAVSFEMHRMWVKELLQECAEVEESGGCAQENDLGIVIKAVHEEYGPGYLYFQTIPERRRSGYQIAMRALFESVN